MTLPAVTAPVAVYRFFDSAGVLLYVGKTRNPTARWKTHASTKSWWSEVTKSVIDWHSSEKAALAAETDAIATEHPRYNVAGNPETSSESFDAQSKVLHVRIEPASMARLGALAERERRTVSDLARLLLLDGLERMLK